MYSHPGKVRRLGAMRNLRALHITLALLVTLSAFFLPEGEAVSSFQWVNDNDGTTGTSTYGGGEDLFPGEGARLRLRFDVRNDGFTAPGGADIDLEIVTDVRDGCHLTWDTTYNSPNSETRTSKGGAVTGNFDTRTTNNDGGGTDSSGGDDSAFTTWGELYCSGCGSESQNRRQVQLFLWGTVPTTGFTPKRYQGPVGSTYECTATGNIYFDGAVQLTFTTKYFIVDTRLKIEKTFTTPAAGSVGETVTYTAVLSHASGALESDATNEATSFGSPGTITITDTIPGDLDLVVGSVTVNPTSIGANAVTIVTGNTGGDTTIEISVPSTSTDPFDASTTLTITYACTLNTAKGIGDTMTNTIDASYTGNLGNSGTYTVSGTSTITYGGFYIVGSTDPTTTKSEYTDSIDDIRPGEETFWIAVLDLSAMDGTKDIKVKVRADERAGCEMYNTGSPALTLGTGISGATTSIATRNELGLPGYAEAVEFSLGSIDATGGTAAENSVSLQFNYTLPDDDYTYSSNLKEVPGSEGLAWTACQVTVEVFEDGVLATSYTQAVDYEVVDVELRVFKNLVGNNTNIDGGDVLQFTIDVSHVDSPEGDASELSFGEAHNVIVSDQLNGYLTLVEGSVTTTAGTIVDGNNPGDKTIRVDIPVVGKTDTPRITYQATLSNIAPAATKISNTAVVEATRSIYGNTTFTLNNTATLLTASPEARFVVLDSTLNETGSLKLDGNVTDLAIGENVTIEIQLTLPEGVSTTNQFEVIFATSPGVLEFREYTIVPSPTLNLTTTTNVTETDTNGDGYIDSIFFDFGEISNTPDNLFNDNDIFRVQIVATVPDIPSNQNGVQTSFQGKVIFGAGDVVCYEVTWNEGKSSKVLFPKRTSKVVKDFYDYRDSYAHTGEEEWDRALIYFVIDSNNQTSFVLVYDKPTGPGAPAEHSNPNGGKVFVRLESDGLAGVSGVELKVEDDAGSKHCPIEKSNTALQVTSTDNYCWDEATGTGEFRHSWNNAKTDGIVLGYFPNENWCVRLSWIPAFFWNAGTGDWDDYDRFHGITEVALLSDDSDGITQKTFFSLEESYGLEVCGFTCNFAAGTLASRTDTLKFEFTSSNLELSATSNITSGDANDAIGHTIVLRHPNAACSSDASSSCNDAYDVTLTTNFDEVGPLVEGSLNFISTTGANYTVQSGLTAGDTTITLFFPTFPVDEIFTLTFESLIKQSVQPAEVVETLTNVTAYTHPQTSTRGRPIVLSQLETFAVLTPALVSLIVQGTSFTGTGTSAHNTTVEDLAVGETATLAINVLLPEATANISILVEMPRSDGKLQVIGSELVSVGSSIQWDTSLLTLNGPGVAQDTDGDGIDDAVLFNFGTTVNLANNVISGADEVDISVDVRVLDNPLNSDGKFLPMKASLFYSGNTVSADTYIDLVGPTLTITKTSDISTGDYGDTVTYTVTLSHSGTTDAHTVTVTDTLPSSLTLNTGGTTSQGTVSQSGNQIDVDVGTFVDGGADITIQYTASYNAGSQSLPQGGFINNTVSTVYLVLPGEPYANRTTSDTHSITVTHVCGNGATGAPETCDDGDTDNGDGCDSTCQIEPGYVCNTTVIPAVCVLCGDSTISGPEACDDGNTVAGDGCSSSCLIEPGWYCTGAPSVCTTTCGDGIVAGVEECDDGNTIANDCCSATCTVEGTLCRCDNSASPASPSSCASLFKCWTKLNSHPLCCSLPNILGTCPDRASFRPSL